MTTTPQRVVVFTRAAWGFAHAIQATLKALCILLRCLQSSGGIYEAKEITIRIFQDHGCRLCAARYLEKLHCGTTPVTRNGDYSDVKVIDGEGREIPWNEVSRINQDEMKTLMTGVVNRIHTFLARTLFSVTEDKEFEQALNRTAVPWTKSCEPEYLPDFLMPHPPTGRHLTHPSKRQSAPEQR